jgi:hypothetical protein
METRVIKPTNVFFIESLLLPEEKRSSWGILRILVPHGVVWFLDSDPVYRAWHIVTCILLLYFLVCQVAREQPTARQVLRANPKSMV